MVHFLIGSDTKPQSFEDMVHFLMGAGPDTKSQKVSLQMLVYRTITLRHIFHKKLHHSK